MTKMMKLKIMRPDDSGRTYDTYIGMSGFPHSFSNRRHRFNNSMTIHRGYNHDAHEPTIASIKEWLGQALGIISRGRGKETFVGYIHIGNEENPAILAMMKTETRYSLNGIMSSKDTILTAISRTIFKSCFTDDPNELIKTAWQNVKLPESISYALENRVPFHWYKKGVRIDVRLNVKLIDEEECALEISDGIWAPISIKNLNTMLNFYWHGKQRGSWKFLSPKKLWKRLLNKEPTEAQIHLMLAFLEQNRTSKIVEERAKELMVSLQEQYPDRIKIIEQEGRTNMVIRGKVADWVLTDSTYKSNIQAVSTYVYKYIEDEEARTYYNGFLGGPICIDNMTRHSSLGDQFAARAMALLNDDITMKIVSTIRNYLNKEEHIKGQTIHRIDFDNLGFFKGK